MSGLNAVAVWRQSDGSTDRIYSNYSTDGGATWHTAQLIENIAGYYGFEPQVAMSGLNAVAVWREALGSYNRIYFNYSTDGGATWHTAQLIENNAGYSGYEPQVAMSGLNAVAVWYQNDGSTDRIYSNYLSEPTAESIPTMTEWGMIIFMVLGGLGATYHLRKQKTDLGCQ
jgi:hypothetical protein